MLRRARRGGLPAAPHAEANSPLICHQAMGTRAGELTDVSAIVWTRLSATPVRNNERQAIAGRTQNYKKDQLPQVTVQV